MTARAHAAALLLLAACGSGGELREATERRRAEAAATPGPSGAGSAPVPLDTGGDYRVPAFVDAASAVPAIRDTTPAQPEWSGATREAGGTENRTHTLRGMRVGHNTGFDRLVLDFGTDPVPPYRVEYVDRPVRQCGSGDPVPMPGQGWLKVSLRATRAHDDQGQVTVARRDFDPPTPVIRAVRMVCDFEGRVEVVLALQEPNPSRVLVVPSPNRLIVDVRQ